MRRLDVVAGPNGAGKSTFIRFTLAPRLPGSVLVSADEIARQNWPGAELEHAYDAARLAAGTRERLIEAGTSFVTETVFSHPSKLGLIGQAQAAGYAVFLHVVMVPEQLAVARVARRVEHGGHAVPESKIRQRHRRLWPLIAQGARQADSAVFYDAASGSAPRIVARFSGGLVTGAVDWPPWADQSLHALDRT